MEPWKRIEPSSLEKVGWRKISRKTFEAPDGSSYPADIFDADGTRCVAIIALTPEKKVVIARQFRLGPEVVMDEIPGGYVDEGEDPETAAIRELQEETGYGVGAVTYLGKVYKHAWMNTEWHFYLATDCTLGDKGQELEPTEFVDVDLISIGQLFENARTGKMTDTEGVLLAYDQLKLWEQENHG
jgi:ADP-ribose pyrophosphatase